MNEKLSCKINFEKLNNTRDLGGMPAADGRVIRPGMLIRSGMLNGASTADLSRLESLIELVVDFRTDGELETKPDPEIPGVRNVWVPVLGKPAEGISREEESDRSLMKKLAMDPSGAQKFMAGLYVNLASDEFSREGYRKFVQYLAEPRDKAMLWHCSAGKDRAGMAALITQEILGVPRELVIQDYLETNVNLADDLEAIIIGAQRGMAEGAKEPDQIFLIADRAKEAWEHATAEEKAAQRAAVETMLPPEVVANSRQALAYLFGADRAYPEAFYQTAEKLYGSFEGYLREGLGVTDELRDELRARYLEKN